MSFFEKWYWANYIKGTNPVTSFFRSLILGWKIQLICSLVFCFVTDPQWSHVEGIMSWSPLGYIHYFGYFWLGVVTGIGHYIHLAWSYFWNHMGAMGRFWRHVLFLDHPEYFKGVGND